MNTATLPTPAPAVATSDAPTRLLVLASLYPNAEQPRHGIFVETRLRQLLASGGIQAEVVAPVPWFPLGQACFGRYGACARAPRHEQRHGISVHHPRYPVIPKVGMQWGPALMTRALRPRLRQWHELVDRCEVIDAHYLYPDGVAAVRLGRALGKPVVLSTRGSDVTLLPKHAGPRKHILWACRHAAAIITVSAALKDGLVALGVAPGKIHVLRNGVDLDDFAPHADARAHIRARLALHGPVWLTVGHLIELKGVHLAIRMLAHCPEATLLVAGDGPESNALHALAQQLDVAARVHFLGPVPHAELRDYYNAADALIHPSRREGMPNVVLEALGCGTPVVASPFAGVRELLDDPDCGEVAAARAVPDLIQAWQRLRERAPTRAATRHKAERFGWSPVVAAQRQLYAQVAATGTALLHRDPSA